MQRTPGATENHGVFKPGRFLLALALGVSASAGSVALAMGQPQDSGEVRGSSARAIEAPNVSQTPVTEPTPTLPAAPSFATEVELLVEPTPSPVTPTITPTPAPIAPPPAATVGVLSAGITVQLRLTSDTSQAQILVDRMNAAREAEDLSPLAISADLEEVALARAESLIENNYFDHFAPDGSSAFTELGARGITYAIAGENLARNTYPDARTAQAAFDALMGSPSHRANILESRYGQVGVAAVRAEGYWYFVTIFMNGD